MFVAARPGSEKTATAGGRKQGLCIYCLIMIILWNNDSIPPGHSMKKRKKNDEIKR